MIHLRQVTYNNAFYILLSLVNANHGFTIMKSIKEITKGQLTIGQLPYIAH